MEKPLTLHEALTKFTKDIDNDDFLEFLVDMVCYYGNGLLTSVSYTNQVGNQITTKTMEFKD